MQAWRRHWRFALGAAASVLLHAVLLLLLSRVRPEPSKPPARTPAIEFMLLESAVTKAKVSSPTGAPRAATTSERKQSKASRVGPPKALATAPRAAPAAPGSTTARPDDPGAERLPAWSEAWREGEGVGIGSGSGKPALSLTLNQPGVALGIPEAQPDELPRAERIVPESAETARRRVAGRIDGFAQASNAYRRAEFPDVYWRHLREKLEKGFQIPYEIRDDKSGGGPGKAVARLADRHQRDAAAYGKSGNPFAGEANAPGVPRTLAGDTAALGLEQRGIAQGTLATEMFMRQVGTVSGSQLVARVLISQAEDGKVAEVALADSSGNFAYDRMALKQARLLLGDELLTLGPLPREGRRSLWAFVTDFQRMPPLPLMGCGLDAYFIPRDCLGPMSKTARSRVRLEAIY